MSQLQYISSTFSEYCTRYCGFGFNGQEKDQEIYNNQSTTTATFWEYDGRIGRRWNIDPVVKEWESGYACFNGNPILISDPLGNDGEPTGTTNSTGDPVYELSTANIIELNPKSPIAESNILTTSFNANKYNKNALHGGFKINSEHRIKSQFMKDFDKAFGTLLSTMYVPLAAGTIAPALAEVAPIFSFSKLSWTSLASGGADFLSQMTLNGGKFKNWNITQTLSSAFLKNPFGQSIIGSAFEITPRNLEKRDNILGNTFLFGDKKLGKFATESIIGGLFNHAGSESIQGLAIEKTLVRIPCETSLYYLNYNISTAINGAVNSKTQ